MTPIIKISVIECNENLTVLSEWDYYVTPLVKRVPFIGDFLNLELGDILMLIAQRSPTVGCLQIADVPIVMGRKLSGFGHRQRHRCPTASRGIVGPDGQRTYLGGVGPYVPGWVYQPVPIGTSSQDGDCPPPEGRRRMVWLRLVRIRPQPYNQSLQKC